MATTLHHHDVQRRGTRIHLPSQAIKPVAKRNEARPSAIQRMTFIFGASTMLWLGIAAVFTAF